jgi:hypothetical protein
MNYIIHFLSNLVKKMEQKKILLRNKYTKDEVYTENFDDYEVQGNMKFIRVIDKRDPRRTYLANREAFEVVSQ